jgi:hypothetical protein
VSLTEAGHLPKTCERLFSATFTVGPVVTFTRAAGAAAARVEHRPYVAPQVHHADARGRRTVPYVQGQVGREDPATSLDICAQVLKRQAVFLFSGAKTCGGFHAG